MEADEKRKSWSDRYRNKVILAPMVRVGTLPMRLLALDYGADLVYCEEIIDYKILQAKRIENKLLGTIDYVLSDETIAFRTCHKEKGKVIFQMGTADPKRALLAAKKIEKDVAGIDINMGCPKEFSVKGGMGAALLKKPEKVKEILTTLVQGVSIPVTCKIRILPELEDTLKLVRLIEETGVAALGVHGRTQAERSRHPNHNDVILAVSKTVSIPVIANGGSGEVKCHADIAKFREATGASSVMLARAAMWNCSVFRKDGPLPLPEVIRDYLKYAIEYADVAPNTKYCILQILHSNMDWPEGNLMLAAKTMEEMCSIWGLERQHNEAMAQRAKKKKDLEIAHTESSSFKHRKTNDGKVLIEISVRFCKNCAAYTYRQDYPPSVSPKQTLHEWCKKNSEKNPVYETVERPEDRCFNSVVSLMNKKYTTPFWEKSKQIAEQGAAIACLVTLGMPDGRTRDPCGENEELRRKWLHFENSSRGSSSGQNGADSVNSRHGRREDGADSSPDSAKK